MSDQRKNLFVWLARHKSEAEALREVPADVLGTLWAGAWQDGAWAALHDTSQLSGLIDRLDDLIALYRNAEIDREVERSSVYWSSEREFVEEPLPF